MLENENDSSFQEVAPHRNDRVIFPSQTTVVVQTSVKTSVSSHVRLMSGGSTHIVRYPTGSSNPSAAPHHCLENCARVLGPQRYLDVHQQLRPVQAHVRGLLRGTALRRVLHQVQGTSDARL
ncbi:hypothetical protein TNCT_123811 [Trichonephila clavata]|uniref:Uncharacterized protein n=1 Tax=Trichonephila clavata TaxID=2740835 RepID=A0A8X6JU65_TRICU|nr:hypothetical protein TNCT_123811 [Trichonephila clavata]